MFTLSISCWTTSNLPRFMDLTFQVPMQYCSLQYWILLSLQTHPPLGIISTLTQPLHSFWSYSNCPLFPSSILDTFRYEAVILISYLFAFLCSSVLHILKSNYSFLGIDVICTLYILDLTFYQKHDFQILSSILLITFLCCWFFCYEKIFKFDVVLLIYFYFYCFSLWYHVHKLIATTNDKVLYQHFYLLEVLWIQALYLSL